MVAFEKVVVASFAQKTKSKSSHAKKETNLGEKNIVQNERAKENIISYSGKGIHGFFLVKKQNKTKNTQEAYLLLNIENNIFFKTFPTK